MKARMQKFIAVGVMGLGALVGLWISGSKGAAQAQSSSAQEMLPPPQDFNPEHFPVMPPAGENAPSDGAAFPPIEAPQSTDPSLFPPMDASEHFKTVNPEGFIYNPEGLRDPFFPVRKGKGNEIPIEETATPVADVNFNPQDPLQAYPLNEYRLVGILWDVREPRAMVQTPNGKVYSLRKKIRLGREGAVVAAVREREIVVVQPNPDGSYVNATTRVINMKK